MAPSATEQRIIVVMGVTGSGKTTIGRHLAERLRFEFCDADDFHGADNIAKMARGEALTDADRSEWLSRLRQRIDRAVLEHESLVLACSALKQRYRQELGLGRTGFVLVYLRATRELAARRLSMRSGHFMPASLVSSQFSDLEEPADAIVIDADQPIEAIVSQIVAALGTR